MYRPSAQRFHGQSRKPYRPSQARSPCLGVGRMGAGRARSLRARGTYTGMGTARSLVARRPCPSCLACLSAAWRGPSAARMGEIGLAPRADGSLRSPHAPCRGRFRRFHGLGSRLAGVTCCLPYGSQTIPREHRHPTGLACKTRAPPPLRRPNAAPILARSGARVGPRSRRLGRPAGRRCAPQGLSPKG